MPLQKSNTEQAVEDCDKIKILNKELMAIIIIIIIQYGGIAIRRVCESSNKISCIRSTRYCRLS